MSSTTMEGDMQAFQSCLAFTLREEGGFVCNSKDLGGATNFGICFTTLDHWRGEVVTDDDMENLTEQEASAIYRVLYWNAMKCGSLPAGLDLMVFDHGVNAGTSRSVRLLQGVLGVTQDAIVGAHTISAAWGVNVATTITTLAMQQQTQYESFSNFADFGKGWLARLYRREAEALSMASQAIKPKVTQ